MAILTVDPTQGIGGTIVLFDTDGATTITSLFTKEYTDGQTVTVAVTKNQRTSSRLTQDTMQAWMLFDYTYAPEFLDPADPIEIYEEEIYHYPFLQQVDYMVKYGLEIRDLSPTYVVDGSSLVSKQAYKVNKSPYTTRYCRDVYNQAALLLTGKPTQSSQDAQAFGPIYTYGRLIADENETIILSLTLELRSDVLFAVAEFLYQDGSTVSPTGEIYETAFSNNRNGTIDIIMDAADMLNDGVDEAEIIVDLTNNTGLPINFLYPNAIDERIRILNCNGTVDAIESIGTDNVKTGQRYFSMAYEATAGSNSVYTYNDDGDPVSVDWGDGSYTTSAPMGLLTHTYATAGNYNIKILESGFYSNSFRFNNMADAVKCTAAYSAGSDNEPYYELLYLDNMFYGCSNLSFVAPNIFLWRQNAVSATSTFMGCTSLVTAPEMPSSLTTMYSTFRECWNLTGDIVLTSEDITSFAWCFLGCDPSKPKILKCPAGSTTYTTAMATVDGTYGVTVEAY